jgi:hypothetical protein
MKWLLIGLFIIGTFCSLSAYGSTDKKQKRIYMILAGAIWLLMLVLANTFL